MPTAKTPRRHSVFIVLKLNAIAGSPNEALALARADARTLQQKFHEIGTRCLLVRAQTGFRVMIDLAPSIDAELPDDQE